MKIYFDSDGFFWPHTIDQKYMKKRKKYIFFDKAEETGFELFEQYYLGFRSAMFICENTIDNKLEAENAIKIYCEDCVNKALAYMRNHIEAKASLPIDFMWYAREMIINHVKNEFPNAKNIKLLLSMKPRISAMSINQNVIKFPALIRAVLIHCNIIIINSINDVLSEDGELIGVANRKQIARFIFPYLLYCHDDFSVRNLPIIGARTEDVIKTAFSYTNLQMIFIFAHEYAHILLNHFDDDKPNIEKENEADSFALKIIMNYTEKNNSYLKQDVLVAVRWLFKFQLLEERIGALARGEVNDYYESSFEKRRSNFQVELFESSDLNGSTLFESVGFCMIIELQNILNESGLELINYIIEEFHKSEETGRIEPWWEKITEN